MSEPVKNVLLLSFGKGHLRNFSNETIRVFTEFTHAVASKKLANYALKDYVERVLKLPVQVDLGDGSNLEASPEWYGNLALPSYSIEKIRERYGLIGFSVTDEICYDDAVKLARELKTPNNKIVFGGNWVSAVAENAVRNQAGIIDYVVKYGGEKAFAGLVRGDAVGTIPNLVYLQDGVVKSNPIEKDYVGEIHANFPERVELFQSSRGCNNHPRCAFCSISSKGYSMLTPEQFASQLRHYIHNNPLLKEINIIDDNFLASHKWVKKCAEIFEREPLPKDFKLLIYAAPNDVTEDIIPALKTLQVGSMFFGCDSGDPDILKSAHKRNTPEDNIRATELALNNGIDVAASYIIGYPNEEVAQMINTSKNALELLKASQGKKGKLRLQCQILAPYPGSEYFNLLCKHYPKYKTMDSIDMGDAINDFQNIYFNDK